MLGKGRALITGGSGAVLGAVLVFLLQSQTEGIRSDGHLLAALSELSEQMTVVVENQSRILDQFDDHTRRLNSLERGQRELSLRLEDQTRRQTDLETGQIKLRLDLERVSHKKQTSDLPGESVAEVMREILVLQETGAAGVWLQRGPPYANTNVLSRRLARRVTSDERDQAAALLMAAQRFRDRNFKNREEK